MRIALQTSVGLSIFLVFALVSSAVAESPDPTEEGRIQLVAALLQDTPLEEDLLSLTDDIGGRPTGSQANEKSVAWAMDRFRRAGLEPQRESFTMPELWLENSSSATITGTEISFHPRVVASPFSQGGEFNAALVDGGDGSDADVARLGESIRGAMVMVRTEVLKDVPGLFAEYGKSAVLEPLLLQAGAAGVIYMGSRPGNGLHRHNAALGMANEHPILIMERDGAKRVIRLLERGEDLRISVNLNLQKGAAFQAENVVAEIKGWGEPEEFVVIGAHLDSWGLGTGALDNGCNVALVIDVARQMKRLKLKPRRTIRFVLFNGEEQGLHGSRAYTKRHREELNRTVMASSYDIGSGRILGFFTGGRPDTLKAVEQALEGVEGLGPFENLDIPIVGTDNFDFMMEGVANLVGNQASANYGPNYHARSDTFDKVNLEQLRLNTAIAAAVTWAFANLDLDLPRQSRAEIQNLIDGTDLGDQMRMFGYLEEWNEGRLGRRKGQ